MKKDKAVRKADSKSAIKSKIKGMTGPIIVLLLILVGVLVVTLYEPKEEERKVIEVYSYSGDGGILTLENQYLRFEMDGSSTQFSVTDKASGAVWDSNPKGCDEDPLAIPLEKSKLQSTLHLYYSTDKGMDTLFANYGYSIQNGLYDIEQGEDYIKVYYTLGTVEREFVIPTVLTVERMDELTAGMDKDTSRRVTGYYKKYDINNLGSNDDKDALLEQYPILESQVAYVLRDTATDNVKGILETAFAAVGYTYEDFLEDKEMASGEASSSDKPVFNVSMVYRLEDDKLVVEVPLEDIEYPDEYPVYNLNVLPYFGAGSTEDDGYLLVPEGGGAIINFNNGKTTQSSYYANMYGWDYAQYREEVVNETNTYFNAFGIAKNGHSFLCTLEDGAPYAGIYADISQKVNSYNFVYAQYTLLHREVYEIAKRSTNNVYMYENQLPEGSLVLNYRFIDSDSYADIALAYRDYLQELFEGRLTETKEASTPTVIEIVGAVDKVKQVLGVPVSKPLELTTYHEAQSILEQLQADGVRNMSVKLSGWMNGGVQQKLLDDVHLISDLGSKKDLKNLTSYAKENGIDLYLDGITNYAYDSDVFDGFVTFAHAARFASKEKAEIHPYSTVTFSAREGQDPHYLLHASMIPDMVENLVKAADTYDANVSFADIGQDLSSDFYRKSPVSRQSAMDQHIEMLEQIKEDGMKVMINMGNNYAIPYSDIVTNMDLRGSDYTILDQAVPVYQMAIHGYVSYTGESLNLTQNLEEELLRSAEYGAGLAFTFMDETAFTLQKTLYTEYFGAEYDAWHDRMIEIYTRYDSELGHTFAQRMVGHDRLTVDLSCTEYEDGTKVYVNYGFGEATTPDGRQVPARDYLVVR